MRIALGREAQYFPSLPASVSMDATAEVVVQNESSKSVVCVFLRRPASLDGCSKSKSELIETSAEVIVAAVFPKA